MKKLIQRPQYLEKLIGFRDKELIKVVTGIRRCGKSTLFELYEEYLLSKGVAKRQIIKINLEDPRYHTLHKYVQLYEHIDALLQADCMNYIFIDEVQIVQDFQRAVDGLFIQKNCDVYITGSNANILSGELATLLSGRYVEIKMLPLSFMEYVSTFDDKIDLANKYRAYIENSSFPYVLDLKDKASIRAYLGSIFDSVILKDIVARKKISDIPLLNSITRFVFDNIGNITSSTNIANTLCANGRKVSVHTVGNYLEALSESFILYKVKRYDIKGRQQLVTLAKYYLPDIGLRYYLLGSTKSDMGHILENAVYLELLRRGYEVFVGKISNTEVDFIAINADGIEYYQVAYTVLPDHKDASGKTILERELAPLEAIPNHNPKYLLTMDLVPAITHNGIRQIYVLDWLLADAS